MAFRDMPDHIRKAILSGNTELLRRAGTKGGAKKRSAKRIAKQIPSVPDGKSRGAGEN